MSDAVKETIITLNDVVYKPYLAEIGFVIVKHKVEIDKFLVNLYNKADQEQFEYIKKINPQIDLYAMPGDMLIIMNKPPRALSEEEQEDLKEAQKDALEVSSIRKTLPDNSFQSEMQVNLAAVDTSCLNVDNHTTACVNQKYGSFEEIKGSSTVQAPTAQGIMNFFQIILEEGCVNDPTNCVTTGIGAHLAASDGISRVGGDTNAMAKLKDLLDSLNELMIDNAKKMNTSTSKIAKNLQRNEFIRKKQSILKELKSKINKNMMKAIDIPIDRKLKTSLGISTKANIYQARGDKKIVGIKGSYASRYKFVVKVSKTLKVGGYIAAAIGTAQTMYEAYAMCSIDAGSSIATKYNLSQKDLNNACTYQTEQSIAKSTGLIGGGMVGGYVGYLVCNAAFGVESLGTSIFWCTLVVGGLTAAGGSWSGSKVSEIGTDYVFEELLQDENYIEGKINASQISGEKDLYR